MQTIVIYVFQKYFILYNYIGSVGPYQDIVEL